MMTKEKIEKQVENHIKLDSWVILSPVFPINTSYGKNDISHYNNIKVHIRDRSNPAEHRKFSYGSANLAY
jgi:hypothetical protein